MMACMTRLLEREQPERIGEGHIHLTSTALSWTERTFVVQGEHEIYLDPSHASIQLSRSKAPAPQTLVQRLKGHPGSLRDVLQLELRYPSASTTPAQATSPWQRVRMWSYAPFEALDGLPWLELQNGSSNVDWTAMVSCYDALRVHDIAVVEHLKADADASVALPTEDEITHVDMASSPHASILTLFGGFVLFMVGTMTSMT